MARVTMRQGLSGSSTLMQTKMTFWCRVVTFGLGIAAASMPAQSQGTASSPVATCVTSTAAPADSPEVSAARRLIDTGHPQQALDGLKDAGASQAGVDRMRGLALYGMSRLPDADTAFAAALTVDPTDKEAAQMRALTLFRLGRPAAAIPLLEGARDASTHSKVDPSYLLALCYMDTRRYDDARRSFAAQYGFPPDSAAAYLLAARMLFRREYRPIAQEFASKAVALDERLPLAHGLLGEIALASNHLDEAIAEFEKERARDPLEPSVYDRLGDAYSRAARYTEAQQSLQRAVLLEPNATGPYILLGKVMLKRGDPVGALTYLQRALAMDKDNFMTHSLLAQAYRGVGRTDEASRETEIAGRIQAASEPKLETPK